MAIGSSTDYSGKIRVDPSTDTQSGSIGLTPYVPQYAQGTKEETYAWLQTIGVHLLNQEEITINHFLTPNSAKIPHSPFATQTFSIENLFLFFMLLKMSKTPDGLKTASNLLTKYMDSNVKIIDVIERAGVSHPITACLAHMLAADFMHSRNLLDDASYLHQVSHVTSVFDKIYPLQWLSGVSTLVQAVNPAGILKNLPGE
jgi:hypothetical protein